MTADGLRYALNLLRRRFYTKSEIRDRLKRKGFKAGLELVLDRLVDLDLINDRRYVGSFVREKFELQGFARKRLFFELKKKGVGQELIAEGLLQIGDEAELERAQKLLKQKPLKTREQALAFLARKGFSYGLIKKLF